MVAKITVPKSIIRALNYNEQKMKEGKAECIYANYFLKDANQLNFYEKLNRFEQLIALNKRATTNTVHISLNFALNDKLTKEKLVEIASVYMNKIGFGEQPYLVYKHLDAGHPHVHIVTTNIQKDGRRISIHNLGRNESNKARREIETTFGLIRAEDQKKRSDEINPVNVQRVLYGRSPTKRAITNVLDAVLPHYKYASLAELNAVLKLYNVTADRGKEKGIIFTKNGLVYRVIDEKGNKIGVPIKASFIYNKPTLAYLEKRFSENEVIKREYKKNLKTSIDWIMMKLPKNLQAFKEALQKEKIRLVIRQNEKGFIYGLTYIDHNTKSVFNGSNIGKEYSAKAIIAKCGSEQAVSIKKTDLENQVVSNEITHVDHSKTKEHKENLSNVLNEVINPTEPYNYLPYHLRKHKRKKKKSH